jgi:hypothetical protein
MVNASEQNFKLSLYINILTFKFNRFGYGLRLSVVSFDVKF